MMFLDRTAEEAYKLLLPFKPFVPFRDASCGPSSFHLTVFDCVKVWEACSAGRLMLQQCSRCAYLPGLAYNLRVALPAVAVSMP